MLVNIDSDKAEEERPSVLHLQAACLAVLQRDALLIHGLDPYCSIVYFRVAPAFVKTSPRDTVSEDSAVIDWTRPTVFYPIVVFLVSYPPRPIPFRPILYLA